MQTRRAVRVERFAVPALAFALAFLACGAAMASDVERRIPVVRDAAGSGVTVDISREGTRRTATPSLLLFEPTVRRAKVRIAEAVKKSVRAVERETSAGTTTDAVSRIGAAVTQRFDSGRLKAPPGSLPPVPAETTFRGVRSFLKGLRASRKAKTVRAAVAAPEMRLGRADVPASAGD